MSSVLTLKENLKFQLKQMLSVANVRDHIDSGWLCSQLAFDGHSGLKMGSFPKSQAQISITPIGQSMGTGWPLLTMGDYHMLMKGQLGADLGFVEPPTTGGQMSRPAVTFSSKAVKSAQLFMFARRGDVLGLQVMGLYKY